VNVAILLSTHTWEEHFGERLGLSRETYLGEWRAGWVWSYCRMLAGEGIVPSIYVPVRAEPGAHVTAEGFRVRFLGLRAAHAAFERVPFRYRSGPVRYATSLVNGWALLPALRAAIAEDGIDVLAVQEYWTGRYDLLTGRIPRPIVAIDQGFDSAREVKLAKRRTLPRAAKVITQTGAETEALRALGADAERIPNGVATDYWTPDPSTPREPGLIFTPAQLTDSHKRQSDIIRAVARLEPPWHAVLAGRGHDREMLEALARELGVADRVTFAGFMVDREEVRRLYRRCSAFVLPSAREGLPISLLEAMSTGAPVVGSEIPAIADVVTDGVDGLLVPVGAPDRLAAAIAGAAERSGELGAAARRTIEDHYSEAAVGARLARVLGAAARSSNGVPASSAT
jgi:glycosyltransferase involved in cell wall biosynthesis